MVPADIPEMWLFIQMKGVGGLIYPNSAVGLDWTKLGGGKCKQARSRGRNEWAKRRVWRREEDIHDGESVRMTRHVKWHDMVTCTILALPKTHNVMAIKRTGICNNRGKKEQEKR